MLMNCEPNWWVIAGQFATPLIVALVGGYFAWQQSSTAKKKLRLDLFDKRFGVFDAARKFVGRSLVTGGVSIDDQNAFLTGVSGALFLLNDDIAKHLDEILRRAIDMPFLQQELANEPRDEERKKLEAKYLAERRWMRDQTNELERRFKPFLQLDG